MDDIYNDDIRNRKITKFVKAKKMLKTLKKYEEVLKDYSKILFSEEDIKNRWIGSEKMDSVRNELSEKLWKAACQLHVAHDMLKHASFTYLGNYKEIGSEFFGR